MVKAIQFTPKSSLLFCWPGNMNKKLFPTSLQSLSQRRKCKDKKTPARFLGTRFVTEICRDYGFHGQKALGDVFGVSGEEGNDQ